MYIFDPQGFKKKNLLWLYLAAGKSQFVGIEPPSPCQPALSADGGGVLHRALPPSTPPPPLAAPTHLLTSAIWNLSSE